MFMAQNRKSFDGRKRLRTIEYIDSQVDINDDEINENGAREKKSVDLSSSFIEPTRILKRNLSESRSTLQRRMSDISLNRLVKDSNKTTELKGRDHVARLLKPIRNKSTSDLKNHRVVQEMISKRQEKQETAQSIAEFALKYGLTDNQGKKIKTRHTAEPMVTLAERLETLKPSLSKHQPIDSTTPLLRIVKLEPTGHQLLCYCQYIDDRQDLVLFLDPNNDQTKQLAVHDEIRIAGESRIDMKIQDIGSVALGITNIRKENHSTTAETDSTSMSTCHRYDFSCSCSKCSSNHSNCRTMAKELDLRCLFPDENQSSNNSDRSDAPYDSFPEALLNQRCFDLRGTILESKFDTVTDQHQLLIKDAIGHQLQLNINGIDSRLIDTNGKMYIFHWIEYIERVLSPEKIRRWPFERNPPPNRLFCFRSTNNRMTRVD